MDVQDMAYEDAVQSKVLKEMLPQLVLALVKREKGGRLEIPIAEIDDTGGYIMTMELDQEQRKFIFKVEKKQ